jgi:hypothetical protein
LIERAIKFKAFSIEDSYFSVSPTSGKQTATSSRLFASVAGFTSGDRSSAGLYHLRGNDEVRILY